MKDQPDRPVRAAVLADWLGVTEKTIALLATEDKIIRSAGGRLYNLKSSITRYCASIRKTAAGRGGEAVMSDATRERGRLAKAQADKVEIANKIKLGVLVDAASVETEWSGVLRTIRAGMLALPSRAAARLPHLTPHDVAEIDAEVRALLTEVGNAK